jgi:periodic tryptophan protein 1
MFGGPSTSNQDDEESESDEENIKVDTKMEAEANQVQPGADEFNFGDYEDEQDEPALKMTDVVEVAEDEKIENADEFSDEEDEIIKPTDNLVLVGRVEVDCSSVEVYIYNEEENSLYVHHDFLLPFHILCIEPFEHDPGSQKPGNLCAIGGMEPIIHIYDLDIHQPLEPVMELGVKPSKKKGTKRVGHKDAVLDLAWNRNYQHIMASASVDQKVILWDLENATPSTILKDFAEKVQTLEFNETEAEYLLTGSSDNTIKLFDCRQSDNEGSKFKKWIVEGEVEKVKWNPNEKYHFVAATNSGKIYYFDSRTDEPLWSVDAHEKELTDFGFHRKIPNVLTSSSVDNFLKVWKFDNESCNLVHANKSKIGKIHCIHENPENNWLLALGGDKRMKNFTVLNLLDNDNVKQAFTDLPISGNSAANDDDMEADE